MLTIDLPIVVVSQGTLMNRESTAHSQLAWKKCRKCNPYITLHHLLPALYNLMRLEKSDGAKFGVYSKGSKIDQADKRMKLKCSDLCDSCREK